MRYGIFVSAQHPAGDDPAVRLAEHLEGADGPHAHYALVTVQTHREVSTAISTRLGIRHETPQALLIMDGRVVWSASHFRVTADAIAKAIQAGRAAPSRP